MAMNTLNMSDLLDLKLEDEERKQFEGMQAPKRPG